MLTGGDSAKAGNTQSRIMHPSRCPWMACSFYMPSFGLWQYLPELQGDAFSKGFNRCQPLRHWFCSWEAVQSPASPRTSLGTSSNSFPLSVASQPSLMLPFIHMNEKPPSGIRCQEMRKKPKPSNSKQWGFCES